MVYFFVFWHTRWSENLFLYSFTVTCWVIRPFFFIFHPLWKCSPQEIIFCSELNAHKTSITCSQSVIYLVSRLRNLITLLVCDGCFVIFIAFWLLISIFLIFCLILHGDLQLLDWLLVFLTWNVVFLFFPFHLERKPIHHSL